MGDGVYRDGDGGLRAALADLNRQTGILRARIDRGYLARFDSKRLARLDQKWSAASSALSAVGTVGSTETLARACDAHHALVAEMEDAVANGPDEAKLAAFKKGERVDRLWKRSFFWLFAIIFAAGAIHACNACYERVMKAPMNFN